MATANNKKWWKNSIIYQIYPRSFCDSNGDGIGDIPGIISKLSYLKDLGVDAIWLNPVYASPGYDNGYDISDYKSINPEYGSMEDMEKLISKSKRLGIKIIMDLVINHTSDQHEWFKKALENDPKYRNYYIFKSNKGVGAPNNWGSFFGGKAWSKTSEGSYYLHLFSPNQPDLNWDNPDVYDEMIDIMKFWLDKGVAGFRCDVINCIYKSSLENGKKKIALSGIEHYLNSDGCHEILKRFNQELWSKYKTFSIGETVFITPDEARLFCDENRNELDAVFSFEHMEVDCFKIKWFKRRYKPTRLIKIIDKWQTNITMPANYFENHDQIRSVNHFGNVNKYWAESAKMLCGLNLSLKGIPFIYEGQEIGMTNGDFNSISDLRDIESYNINRILKKILFFAPHIRRRLILQTSRDNARTPMQWDNSLNGGFTTGTPWIKVNSNKDLINVKNENDKEDSILSFYRDMIDFRKNSKALSEGDYRRVASVRDVFIFTRESFEERLYVYCNLSDSNKPVEFYGDYIVFDNYKEIDREDYFLRPYEFRIIKSNI